MKLILNYQKFQHFKDLFIELIKRDFKIKYKRSFLGLAWSLINPVLHLLIFYFIFNIVLSVQIKRYTSFIYIGMIMWTWFSSSVLSAATIITANKQLILQPKFPRYILPILPSTINLINFLISLPVIWMIIYLKYDIFAVTNLYLPILILIQFIFTISLSYFVAAINVLFRDTQYVLTVLLQLWFFCTPIFYDSDSVPEKYQFLYNLNPLVTLVKAYRVTMMYNEFPPIKDIVVVLFFSVLLTLVTLHLFKKMQFRFIEEL